MPWKDADHPNAARWLDDQKETLALAHEAAQRSRYHLPAIPAGDMHQPGETPRTLLPLLADVRYLARMVGADALRHAGDADKTIFIRDLTDAMKIGSLMSGRFVLIEHLVGAL